MRLRGAALRPDRRHEPARALDDVVDHAEQAAHQLALHRVLPEGPAALSGGIDPVVVIRGEDVLASLEGAIDATEHVAHELEGPDLRRGR